MVYLNGSFLPAGQATVSVMDRGFLFGDGVYEVIPVYSRRPFRLAEHLRRLQASLDGIRLINPHTDEEWASLIGRIVETGESEDQSIYVQVTRGPMAVRNHAFPKTVTPTVLIMGEALVTPPAQQREQGIAAISAVDIRWLRCNLKVTSLLANCLLRQAAIDADCVETLLFRDGCLTEGAASNIFVMKDGTLLGPPKNHLMLAGITYDVVLEIAAARGLPYHVRPIRDEEVRAADEVWMTSSTKEVLPIVTLDGKPVGTGRPGPAFERMHGWYQDFKRDVMRGGDGRDPA
ncbi:MAG TPA: D-amino acid aminotransferase [Rhodocyclaceae bacterium]|nr:D-amino acid aminotransferase [Rhodocyclaceae bacterium]